MASIRLVEGYTTSDSSVSSMDEGEDLVIQRAPSPSLQTSDRQGTSDSDEQVAEPENAQPSLPPQSTAMCKRRTPYAAELSELPEDMRQFLRAVKTFFTQKVNLQRQKGAVSDSTYGKAQERMLCFIGYAKKVLPPGRLNPDCFLRIPLIEGYLEFLKVG